MESIPNRLTEQNARKGLEVWIPTDDEMWGPYYCARIAETRRLFGETWVKLFGGYKWRRVSELVAYTSHPTGRTAVIARAEALNYSDAQLARGTARLVADAEGGAA